MISLSITLESIIIILLICGMCYYSYKSFKKINSSIVKLTKRLINMTVPNTAQQDIQTLTTVYKLLMDELFINLYDLHFDTNEWISRSGFDLESEVDLAKIFRRIELNFDARLNHIRSKLRLFKHKGVGVDTYIDNTFISEWAHVRLHIYLLLISKETGIRNYCDTKKQLWNNSFEAWLSVLQR